MFSNETIRKLREIHMGVMAESFLPSWKTRSSGMCPSRIGSPCWWMPNGVLGKATGSLA